MRGWGSISQAPGAAHLIVTALLFATTVHAQLGQQPTPPTTSAGSLPSSQTAGRTGTSSISTEDPFAGSVIAENATDQVITISLKEAINRGLKANLGALLRVTGPRTEVGPEHTGHSSAECPGGYHIVSGGFVDDGGEVFALDSFGGQDWSASGPRR